MAQNMDNVGVEVLKRAVSEMRNAAQQKNPIDNTIDVGKNAAKREAEERTKKLAKEKFAKEGLFKKMFKSPLKALSAPFKLAKKTMKKVAVKAQNAMRTAVSKVRQFAMRSAGNLAAVPTAGASKVAAEKAVAVDKKMTEARNKAAEQKVNNEDKTMSGKNNKKLETVAKKKVREVTKLDAKALAFKTAGLGNKGKKSIVTSKAANFAKEATKPKTNEENNKER